MIYSVVMDITAFKVRHSADTNADATTLRTTRGKSSSIWKKVQEKFKMQALTPTCDAKFMSTRTAAGQFRGQFKGATERYAWGFDLV